MNVERAIGLLTISLGIVFLAASSLTAAEAGPASPTGASVPEGRIVYVAGDGSGDFNCDGKDDHVEINQAIEYVATHPDCSTVHLKGPNTYWISDTIRIGSDTVLEGDSTAVVKLIDHSHWPKYKAMVASKYEEPGLYTTQTPEPIRNITIRGFELDGNSGNNRDLDEDTGRTRSTGAGYDYLLRIMNASDVTINDMHLHDMLCDGILFCNTGDHRNARVNAQIFNNRIESSGHDAIYMIRLSQFAVYNNDIYSCRTNSAIRLTGCSEYSIHHNVIHNHPTAGFSGFAGIQLQNGSRPVDHVEIYENEISRAGITGINVSGHTPFGSQKDIHIHHNRIYDCNLAGIMIYGAHNTLIENNVLYGNWGDAIVHCLLGFPPAQGREAGEPPGGARYTTIVRNNIMANTHPDPGPDSVWGKMGILTPVSGFGLNNYLSDTYTFVSEHNCIYNNAEGDYNNASSTTDIHVDPLFVNPEEGDFHLQPQSPCRDAGGDGKDIGVY